MSLADEQVACQLVPIGLITRIIGSGLRCMGGGANPLMANILATYCDQGNLEPHIEELRLVYRERRDAMLQALGRLMPDGVTWTQPGGGFFIWLGLPPPLRAAGVASLAREAKLLLPIGDPFFAETPTGQCLRLAFSYVTTAQIKAGIEILGRVVRDHLRTG